jgi:hypothetical protein
MQASASPIDQRAALRAEETTVFFFYEWGNLASGQGFLECETGPLARVLANVISFPFPSSVSFRFFFLRIGRREALHACGAQGEPQAVKPSYMIKQKAAGNERLNERTNERLNERLNERTRTGIGSDRIGCKSPEQIT